MDYLWFSCYFTKVKLDHRKDFPLNISSNCSKIVSDNRRYRQKTFVLISTHPLLPPSSGEGSEIKTKIEADLSFGVRFRFFSVLAEDIGSFGSAGSDFLFIQFYS